MRFLALIARRPAVFVLGAVAVWLIVFVFQLTDSRLPTILALSLAYALAAYVILPRIVRMSLKILQRKSVPSFTVTGDGFPGDPVNLVLIGEFDKLRAAFLAAGWTEAEPLGLQVRGAWPWPSCSTGPIRRRRSARSSCSGAARTSASRRRSTRARASATTSASGR